MRKVTGRVIALGMLLVLFGFALMATRGGIPGSAAARHVKLSWSREMNTRGYGDTPTWRYRVIQVLVGLAMVAAGMALIAASG